MTGGGRLSPKIPAESGEHYAVPAISGREINGRTESRRESSSKKKKTTELYKKRERKLKR